MNKCFYSSAFVLVTLLTTIAPKDICESCLPISRCHLFASIDREEQESWMQKYPCKNYHSDDYGNPPGSRTSNQEDLICCSNQVWGIEPKETSSRLTDANRFGNPLDTPDTDAKYRSGNPLDTPHTFDSQKEYPFYPNYNNNGANSNTQHTKSGSNLTPSRGSWTNQNKYWNDRPDKNQWDVGNKNFYQGNNRRDVNNNRRNDKINRAGGNNYNNQGARPNQSDNNYNSRDQRSKFNPYFPRQQGNSFNEAGQCDRLTRFPPNPQSGCCGREASDDDRITEKKTVTKRHTRNTRSTNSTVVKRASNDTSFVEVENRISGGKETEFSQYPWTALLLTVFNNGIQRKAFNCGGSLISSKFVLTAGHCVYDNEAAMESVQVFLAEFDKRTFPRDCKMTDKGRKCIENVAIYAEDVIRHPQFDETRLLNDIALIKLQNDVPYTEYIRPICLPSINIDDPEHNRLRLTVAGWGRNGPYQSDIKQSTTIHLVPQHDCKRFYPDLTRRHLCAAGYTGEDTCKGDSGGPLMVFYRGKYFVVGVVSGKRTDTPCGSTVPSLYTNVYHYLDWIQNNIQSGSGIFSNHRT